MDNNEEWISITEMDRRIKLDQASWQATKQFVASIDWPLLNEQYSTFTSWLAAAKELHQEDSILQLEGVMGLLDNFKDLAVDHFGVPEADAYTFTEEE